MYMDYNSMYLQLQIIGGGEEGRFVLKKSTAKFSLPRSNTIPSEVFYDSFREIPLEARTPVCFFDIVESLLHMFLYCSLYKDLCSAFLDGILDRRIGWADLEKYDLSFW